MTTSDALRERYGAPAPWRRRVTIAASAVVALAFLGWLGWAAWAHVDPQVDSDLVGWSVDGEHAATVKVSVHLHDADVRARCLLRASAADHAIVGELSFVPRYGAPQPLVERVRTERRATSIELVGCTAPGQPQPQ
ncbi:DUF4307 domain-containing protein [Nocardioides panaciterrulae]|uniref:DUF4307 domain-containing protein n=1 Tax=Nocardioides panaciterrulae TaxID=661492 RepID=A0A7Y9JBI0_9ACTN|nr:hypothetical protein [Nocardioides panaciterrulae]